MVEHQVSNEKALFSEPAVSIGKHNANSYWAQAGNLPIVIAQPDERLVK